MSKKKLSTTEQKIKKVGLIAKKYADDVVLASQLKKYEKATANEGYLKTIILSAKCTLQEATADTNSIEIDIPKDFLVKSATLATVATADTPYEGAVVGDKYLDFVINSKDNDDTASHVYLPVQDLVDVYTSGDGIDVSGENVISIKLRMSGNDANSGLAFDANGNLYIAIDPNNANGLAITAAGLKLALAQASTNGVGGAAGAMSAADKEKLDKALTSDDLALMTDAEIGSWFGYSAADTATILASFSDDSITDEE